jgi:predicted phage tail protein
MSVKKKKIDPIERALASPVARAIAKRELQALHAQMAEIGDRCLQVAHESEQRELLASLALMIGVGAEVAAVVPVLGDNRAGLHQALEEVVRMACNGCRWNASWAAQLHLAMEVSAEVMMDDTALTMQVIPGARALAADITAGRIRPDTIAPFELPEYYKNNSCECSHTGA